MQDVPLQQYRQEMIARHQRDTQNWVLLAIVIAMHAWMLFSNIPTHAPAPEIAIPCLIVECICAVSFALRQRWQRLSIFVLTFGLLFATAWAVWRFHQPVFLYLFALVSLIAITLMNCLPALIVTVCASVFIVLLSDSDSALADARLPALILTWATLLAAVAVFHSLYDALDTAWSYQSYALHQVDIARESRAQLAFLNKALQEAQERLESANAQLRHARRAAEEARSLKARFAANVSHEFRTPINLVVGFSEMMVKAQNVYGMSLPAPYWSDMSTIYKNAKHLQALINDVLDVSQLEAGQMNAVKEEVDAREVLLEAIDLAHELVVKKGLCFEVSIPDVLPVMWLDRVRIRQVILNLLSNAVRFTDAGKVSVTAGVEGDCLKLVVADTGAGIPPEDAVCVFEEFHQLEDKHSKHHGGTGLGLTLTKQFVELHGGRIWVESSGVPGQGSTFYVTLPSSTPPPLTRHAHHLPPVAQRDEKRCFLVVDDDDAVLNLFERNVGKHRVICLHSLDEARPIVEAVQPTVLVMDAEKSAQLERWNGDSQHLTIIQCTLPSGKRSIQRYGVADYLVKPVTYDALNAALKKLGKPIQSVLIIDDDQDIVRMFSRMVQLLTQPCRVWKAYSGVEGLALMRETKPDVVILDLLMPEVDGFTMIELMKNDPSLADIPIMVASARGAVEAIVPSARGELTLHRAEGLKPIELVRCVEGLVDALSPSTETAL